MEDESGTNRVQVVFFSGTGGTKRVAESFEKELLKRNLEVEVKNLGDPYQNNAPSESEQNKIDPTKTDLYILVFPVYAFDAPRLIYHWIESLGEQEEGKRIAVISVSGGGEVWPNTGCRNNCCKKLEEKGLKVIYDNMMCMPANMLAEINDHLVMHLINVIPQKVNKALDDILGNNIKRTRFRKSALRKYLTNLENKNANKFTESLSITDECKGCGWCVKNCPMGNIIMSQQTQKPQFLNQCTICLRCIYGCPFHAIQSKSSVIFKKGFNLDAVEKRMEGVELDPVEKSCKGLMFMGVKDYLKNKY